jgi:ZIP family zinc transporter
MVEAAAWGLLAASSLLIGAALGTFVNLPDRLLALLMGFGAGALISALAFELTQEAYALGGADTVALGLGLGALAYYLGDRAIGSGVGVALFISNLPEAISGAGLSVRKAARSWPRGRTLRAWTLVTVVCAASSALGYLLLDGASGDAVGLIQAFAGGAVLMTVATGMLPEAHKLASGISRASGRRGDATIVGLATVLGFALAYLLTTLE